MGSMGEQVGYALLVAAEPPVRHPFAVTTALPQLAAVPPARLVGTSYASVVQLANPDDPNTVLTNLRTAAAFEGPLLVYVAGHLAVDPRQHLLHLALARTTARTIRYTALPWHWISAELQRRPPGTTTVVADLAADTDVWQALVHQEHSLAGPCVLYGAVQLHDRRRRPTPAYTSELARILRTAPTRPSTEQLHQAAAHAAAIEDAAALWLGGQAVEQAAPHPDVDVPEPPTEATSTTAASEEDPHLAIRDASRAGRHGEAASIAASYEQAALRAHGAQSVEVAHWIEVRAFLAQQESADRACQLWLQAAVVRLTAGQPTDHPEVAEAVDRAHGAWHHVSDPSQLRHLGIELLSLRTRVPGKNGARADVQRRLAHLSRAANP
jgi:hypothetical protein